MKKLGIVCSLVLVACLVAPASANLLVNGNWETADETGWTRWQAGWSTNSSWGIGGPPAPEGAYFGHLSHTGNGSFGWYQRVDVPAGDYTVDALWTGSSVGWGEVMLFPASSGQGAAAIVGVIDTGAVGNIAFKKDGGVSWGWEAASLSAWPGGNGGTVTVGGGNDQVVVAVKLGNGSSLSFDQIVLVPEPASLLLLGLPGLLLLRRRRA